MVFSSTLFLFLFLPVTLAGYFLLGSRVRNYWLLLVSLVFFGWSQPGYLWIILLNITINYTCAYLIDRFRTFRKLLLFAAVAANLGLLFYFKYYDFTIETVNWLFKKHIALQKIILPVGISFFTFQGMSYVIDVYRRQVPVQKNILKVGLYIVLFPQLIAGPIVRYRDIAREIDDRRVTLDDFCAGIERFIIGLGKKAVIANTMALTADSIWNNGAAGNTWDIALAGSIAYTLQIYFDFSGYSDMAIGLGRMFGFHFNENFDLPYTSKSITEFWRRWHISLSSWFRDYVYIPLGGNRRHVYFNLAFVFLLTGFWHGASWHYVVWGLWNGAFILLERFFRNRRRQRTPSGSLPAQPQGKTAASIPAGILSKIYTLLVVNTGWILFRAPTIPDALTYLGVIFGRITPENAGFTLFWYLDRWTATILVLGIFFSSSVPSVLQKKLRSVLPEKVYTACKYVLLLLLLYLCIIRITAGTYNPFIYFQF